MLGARIERLGGQRAEQCDQPMRRVVGEVRVGDMTLHTGDGDAAGHAAAPADLDHVAELGGRGRLADEAGVEGFAARF